MPPVAAPEATPPPIGIYGSPLQPSDNGEFMESSPEGGTLFWHMEKDKKGKDALVPYRFSDPPKGSLS